MSVNLGLVVDAPLTVLGILVALAGPEDGDALRPGAAFRPAGVRRAQPGLRAAGGGEFALRAVQRRVGYQLFDQHLTDLLNLAVTLSMAATPLLVLLTNGCC